MQNTRVFYIVPSFEKVQQQAHTKALKSLEKIFKAKKKPTLFLAIDTAKHLINIWSSKTVVFIISKMWKISTIVICHLVLNAWLKLSKWELKIQPFALVCSLFDDIFRVTKRLTINFQTLGEKFQIMFVLFDRNNSWYTKHYNMRLIVAILHFCPLTIFLSGTDMISSKPEFFCVYCSFSNYTL